MIEARRLFETTWLPSYIYTHSEQQRGGLRFTSTNPTDRKTNAEQPDTILVRGGLNIGKLLWSHEAVEKGT